MLRIQVLYKIVSMSAMCKLCPRHSGSCHNLKQNYKINIKLILFSCLSPIVFVTQYFGFFVLFSTYVGTYLALKCKLMFSLCWKEMKINLSCIYDMLWM